MEDYSAKSKQETQKKEDEVTEKKVEKVVTSNVKKKKKSSFSIFAGTIFPEDVQNVKQYIFMDVLLPAFKKTISDVVNNGVRMLLYGEGGDSGSRRDYNACSRNSRTTASTVRYNSYSYDDVIIDNRGEAEEVLSRMDEILDRYGVVSVLDFYDLVGITGRHTDNKYGWTNLKSAYVMRVRDGFVIKLPRALPID